VLGLDLLAAHLAGDFVMQTEDMAQRKLTDWRVRALHVSVYCVPFMMLAWLYGPGVTRSALFFVLLWVTHFLIDIRRWAATRRGRTSPSWWIRASTWRRWPCSPGCSCRREQRGRRTARPQAAAPC
jgi:hypothetical protein